MYLKRIPSYVIFKFIWNFGFRLSEILKSDEDAIKYSDLNGNSLLHIAAKEGNKNIIEMLLEKEIDYELTNMFN